MPNPSLVKADRATLQKQGPTANILLHNPQFHPMTVSLPPSIQSRRVLVYANVHRATLVSVALLCACYSGVEVPETQMADPAVPGPDNDDNPTTSATTVSDEPTPLSGTDSSPLPTDEGGDESGATSRGETPPAESSGDKPPTAEIDPIVEDGDRLYFVGNSYTGNTGGLPNYIERAFGVATPALSVDTAAQYYFGQGLGAMYTNDVVADIEGGDFDLCVITSGSVAQMEQFVPVVGQHCEHMVVYMTWAQNPTLGSMESFRQGTASIVASMREMEQQHGARIVPSGLVYYDLINEPPREGMRLDWLYRHENIHQNGLGIVLNTYVFYGALVGKSPVGIEYEYVHATYGPVVSGETVATDQLDDGTLVTGEVVFDEELRTAMQARAWELVQAWNSGTTEFD